jgi:mRNA interferase MazF
MGIKQFDVYLVSLDPAQGSEIRKTRPCVIISPNEINDNLATVIIAPLTSVIRKYPTRIDCTLNSVNGQVALDQLRTVDKLRLKKKLGSFRGTPIATKVLDTLQKIFAP